MSFEWLDIILFIVVLISALLAMMRGFFRELLSIISWIIAIALAIWLSAGVAELLIGIVPDLATYPQLPLWLGAISIMIITLIVLGFITAFIANRIIDNRIGSIDRMLGFLFGVVRGIVLMSVALVGFLWLAHSNVPDWIANAYSKPMLEGLANTLNNALPDNLEKTINDILQESRK